MGLLTRLLSFFPFAHARKWQEAAPEWRVLVDDKHIAVLCAPFFTELAWVSLEIVPLEEPADPRLFDDAFWLGNSWRLVDSQTGLAEPFAAVSGSGLDAARRRVSIWGLRTGRT